MKKLSFEESIEKLEDIINRLEGGEESLESSIKLFDEGTKLSINCYQTLKRAKRKVTMLSQKEAESEE